MAVLALVASWPVYPAHVTMRLPISGSGASSYLKHLSANKEGNAQQQYGRSKLLCVFFMKELAARVPASRVILNSQDPGAAWTGLTNSNKEALVQRLLLRITSRPVEVYARTLANAVAQGEDTVELGVSFLFALCVSCDMCTASCQSFSGVYNRLIIVHASLKLIHTTRNH